MINHDGISPYWGIRTSLAIGDAPTALLFLEKAHLREADRCQLICDFFWREPIDSPIKEMIHKGLLYREVFWLTEAIGYDHLPFSEEEINSKPNKPISAKLSKALAIKKWYSENNYNQKPVVMKLSTAPLAHSLEWLLCPYDPAIKLLFEASVPPSYKQDAEVVKLFWYYLINENGGPVAWNLLKKRIGTSTLFQEWSEIREEIKKSLLHLSGLQTQKSGSPLCKRGGT